ncbi:MAG TPA: hypothetical protein VMW25_01095, partial [Clostridia bacterium]|nr:hypothetical protein [Clostridia bacterium]
VTEISRDDIVYSGGVIAVLVIMAVGFFAGFMFSNLDDTNELSALRLELDLNQVRADGFEEGYVLVQRACQTEIEKLVAECNSRLSEVKK